MYLVATQGSVASADQVCFENVIARQEEGSIVCCGVFGIRKYSIQNNLKEVQAWDPPHSVTVIVGLSQDDSTSDCYFVGLSAITEDTENRWHLSLIRVDSDACVMKWTNNTDILIGKIRPATNMEYIATSVNEISISVMLLKTNSDRSISLIVHEFRKDNGQLLKTYRIESKSLFHPYDGTTFGLNRRPAYGGGPVAVQTVVKQQKSVLAVQLSQVNASASGEYYWNVVCILVRKKDGWSLGKIIPIVGHGDLIPLKDGKILLHNSGVEKAEIRVLAENGQLLQWGRSLKQEFSGFYSPSQILAQQNGQVILSGSHTRSIGGMAAIVFEVDTDDSLPVVNRVSDLYIASSIDRDALWITPPFFLSGNFYCVQSPPRSKSVLLVRFDRAKDDNSD